MRPPGYTSLDERPRLCKRLTMAKMGHFEIPVEDIARTQGFTTSVLGSDDEPWGDEMATRSRLPEVGGIRAPLVPSNACLLPL